MITTQSIVDKINLLLIDLYPECIIYIQKVPQNFKRPSFFINLVTGNTEDNNFALVNESLIVQIVYFAPVNEHYIADKYSQLYAIDTVKKEFKKGYIQVEDRAIKINKFICNSRDDEIYITLDLDYIENRVNEASSGGYDEFKYELMKEIHIKEG